MTITIGTLSFDKVEYDADADVLHLSVGEPRMPAESFGTPEGHNIRYDDTGAVIAITIVNAKWLLERDGEIRLTILKSCAGSRSGAGARWLTAPRNIAAFGSGS
ncbi:MAG TPA: DUF2283 domain-containing protein [Solirubrobacteraceae bacterium]|nr:DUF2283 domain-containing protein [Solirubrobacteraceae bacterium]